jgi:p-aminobenzoyl-glutamate transporter AbgT
MFLGHDLTWWSFVLSAATLVLAIPMAVVGTVLTPKIQNWWAERSEAATRMRITTIENQLSEYETNYELLSEAEDWTLKGIEAIGMTVSLILGDLGLLLSLTRDQKSIFNDPHGLIVPPVSIVAFATLATLLFALMAMYLIFKPIGKFRTKRSPAVRENLRKSIEKLKSSLLTK